MANEFIIREGFNSKSDVIVTGSLTATSITGSLITASYADTASYSFNSTTASLIQNITSASYATTALSASIASASYKTLNNSASLYASYGISSSLWTTTFGNNGYISSTFFNTNGNMFGAVASLRTAYANNIFLHPVYINKTGTLSRFAIFGSLTGATPATSWRVAVYSNSNLMLPQTKLFEFDSNIIPTTARYFYEVSSSSSGPVLQQGQIYWLAALAEGGITNLNYVYLQSTAAYPSTNRIMNPLLGSLIPASENAIRNISHYTYFTPSTGSALPASLSQSITFYTASAYGGTQVGQSGSLIPVGPFIKLNY
jgi:hypothetical protein